MTAQLITARTTESCDPSWRGRGWYGVLGHSHTYSGRPDHGGAETPPASYQRLLAWCRSCGVDAVGMGSPYTPGQAMNYARYDGDDRERYYRSDVDQGLLRDDDEVTGMLAQANRLAGTAGPLLYLDNETPKARFGHLWWLGWHYDFPAWHDYDQPFDRWMLNELTADNFDDEPMPYARRPYSQIVAAQRAKGALGFWAHPTSWWRGGAEQFVTNIASEMPAHAIADGYLDGMVIMGYQPYRPQYLEVWYDLLDRGYRVPGVAEMDCGLSDPATWRRDFAMLTHARLGHDSLSVSALKDAFRSGQLFVSSGPFVDISVDGSGPGDVAQTAADAAHDVRIVVHASPAHPRPLRVDLIGRGGRVVWTRNDFTGGEINLRIPGLSRHGYLVVRVVDAEEFATNYRAARQVAISSPVYLHPRGESFNRPATTLVHVRVDPSSEFAGGEVRFERADGELLTSAVASSGQILEEIPANGRITIVAESGVSRTDYLINVNPMVQQAQRYLYRGRFLKDFPSAVSGEVPVAAWQFDKFAEAMLGMTMTYGPGKTVAAATYEAGSWGQKHNTEKRI